MFKKIIGFFLISAFLSSPAFAGPPPFCYQEEDGAPSGCFKKIKFANGTLTDNGDGTYSHSQAGAGGGDITDVGTCSSGGCLTDGTNNVLTFEGTTADTIESKLGVTDPTVGDQTFNLPDMAAGGTYTIATTSSNVATATALAADPSDCSVGQAPIGINASGVAQSCTTYLQSEVDGSTTNEIQNLFETFNASSGTDPVADSSTDTLNVTGGTGITVTGDSATDTLTIASTVTDTNASTICAGTTTYLDGEGNCDDISSVYEAADASIIKSGEIDTSSEIAGIVSDETGTGALVFGTSPTIATPALTLSDGNGSAPTTDGLIKYDRTTERLQVGDGSTTREFVDVGTLTDTKLCTWDATGKEIDCNTTASGGSGSTALNLPIYSAKLTGAFTVFTPPTADACSQGAQIDAGDGNWRLLFDATTDECATWQFVVPDNYSSTPALNVYYAMSSATSLDVEFEASIMCVTSGDSADIGTASFSNVATATETVPGTAGYMKKLTITLTDDSCSAGDIAFVVLSTDANDATNDDATGDREVVGVEFDYA